MTLSLQTVRDEVSLDWESASALLLERMQEAAFAIRRDGRVALANQKLLKLLARPRSEVLGHAIDDVLPMADGGDWPLAFALRGTLPSFECATPLRDGGLLLLGGDLGVIGAGDGACLLGVVTRHQAPPRRAAGLRYEVRLAPTRGELERVWLADGAVSQGFDGALCYRELRGRDAPCEGCPVFATEGAAISTGVVSSPEAEGVRVISTRCTGAQTAEITSVDVNDNLVSALVTAKVDRLAAESGLTEREHAVLRYILLARSPEEIGSVIGISPRTVKFHQANLLQKLGAESRLDLMRLIF